MGRVGFGLAVRRLSLALALAACAGPAAPRGAAAGEPPDLTGHWAINTDQSEDARKKLSAKADDPRGKGSLGVFGRPGPRSGGPMGGGPMGGRPTGAPPGGRTRSPEEGTRMGGLVAEVMDPPKTLVIGNDGGEVTFDTGGETLLRLRPGGRKVKRDGGTVELKARWKDDELVVDAEHEDGDKMTTTYRIGSDRQSLYVTSKVEPAEGEDLTVRWVYDAAKAPAPAP